jgi:2-methylaconitate cis-trans-isomerase PrpF
MKQKKLPAAFIRGGTSNAVVFRQQDLPMDPSLWPDIFLAAIGSPDPYGRQLDGMGGGLSSLSKVCIVGPSTHPDADVDYTFVQVAVKEAKVDFSGNCGNMSSAIGPFAVDEGFVKTTGKEALVRVHNTNTKKIIWSRFEVDEGLSAVDGDLAIPGVAGTGSPVRLEFRDPGGATTGKLLPTGNVVDVLDVPGHGQFKVSMVDAGNACCFLAAEDLGLTGVEMPDTIEGNKALLDRLQAIRLVASVTMGVSANEEEAKAKRLVPFIGFVSKPQDSDTLTGERVMGHDVDLSARIISNGQPHRALPLAATLCMAVAARINGSVVHSVTRVPSEPDEVIRIAMPSGILTVAASVKNNAGAWVAEQGAFYRTQRRLFDGHVYMSAAKVSSKL